MDHFPHKLQVLLLCLIILGNGINSAYAQNTGSIQGIVKSFETTEAVHEAEVSLNPGKLGTITNENGFFQFKNLEPGKYTLKVSHLGCLSIQKKN